MNSAVKALPNSRALEANKAAAISLLNQLKGQYCYVAAN